MSQIFISCHFYTLQFYFHVIFRTKGYYPIYHISWFVYNHNDLVKSLAKHPNIIISTKYIFIFQISCNGTGKEVKLDKNTERTICVWCTKLLSCRRSAETMKTFNNQKYCFNDINKERNNSKHKNKQGDWINKVLIIIIVTIQLLQDLSKHITTTLTMRFTKMYHWNYCLKLWNSIKLFPKKFLH